MPPVPDTGSREAFVATYGHLFEHSPWVASETFDRGPFRDAVQLHAALCETLRRATPERQLALINAHPDLAGRLAQLGKLTEASKGEQASAGLNRLDPAELDAFQRLTAEYRTRFGFPFIICARLNAKDDILRALRARLGNTPAAEHAAALAEIEKIAWLRLQDVLKPTA